MDIENKILRTTELIQNVGHDFTTNQVEALLDVSDKEWREVDDGRFNVIITNIMAMLKWSPPLNVTTQDALANEKYASKVITTIIELAVEARTDYNDEKSYQYFIDIAKEIGDVHDAVQGK